MTTLNQVECFFWLAKQAQSPLEEKQKLYRFSVKTLVMAKKLHKGKISKQAKKTQKETYNYTYSSYSFYKLVLIHKSLLSACTVFFLFLQ